MNLVTHPYTFSFRILFVVLLHTAPVATAQIKIGANPTTIDPSNSLEVESLTPGNKISINKMTGKLKIADGSQAENRVLTSDANGVATWKSPTNLVVLARNQDTLQPAGPFYTPNVPFVSGDASTWNSATGEFTASTNGFYQYNLSLDVLGILGEIFTINVLPMSIADGNIRGSSAYWNNRTVTGIKYLQAGEKISQFLSRGGEVPFDASWKIRNLAIVVFKIY